MLVMKLRRFSRAVAGLLIVDVDNKQGAACNVSAAIAATWGAAAEEPKNVHGVVPCGHGDAPVAGLTPNPPAPVTETPSVAVMSGFIRLAAWGVARVGP